MKKVRLLGVALFLTFGLFAQESGQTLPVMPEACKAMVSQMVGQIRNTPQEKVYLHLDKPYYSAGERLWFRIYMVHAGIHSPISYSRYVYVELLNAHNEVLLRKKIRPSSDTIYFGQIDLPPELSQGWYSIRAYTNYMRNIDESYFYRQKIYIGNALKGLNGVSIDEKTASNNSDVIGKAEKRASFDVQFFPEGGHLLAGNLQSVGFKAIGRNGLGTNISGKIIDSGNKEIATFKSTHIGMGLFTIAAAAGMNYTAVCEDANGQQLTFKLPEVSDHHYALRVKQTPDMINISVLTPNGTLRKDTLYLIAALRGIPIFQKSILPDSPGFSFSKKGLKSGVTQLLLINDKDEILSERLVYISGNDKASLHVTSDKQNYAKRSPVHTSVLLKDAQGNPVEGNFSVSVTDDNDVRIDSNETTIESFLLLQSDLRGNIEKPNEYFRADNKAAVNQLDLLMLTQGWKRYEVADTLSGNHAKGNKYGFERNAMISGKVQTFPARRGLSNTNVSILFHNKINFGVTTTDNHGQFNYLCPDFPDSSVIMVQASKKVGQLVELVVYPDTFPKINSSCVFPDNMKQDAVMKSFLNKSRTKYNYENGVMSATLKGVVVTAKKEDKNKKIREDGGALYSYPNYTFDEKVLSTATTIIDLLMQAPGVTQNAQGTGVLIRNATPLILVNNVEYPMEGLQSLNVNDVKLIDILKDISETAVYGSKASNGVICIYLKRGGEENPKEPVELGRHQKEILPLGYASPDEFYTPKYQIEENRQNPLPDLRSTIYWNPKVKSNANGEADLFFYTADASGTYTITVEGVTPKGEIIRYQGKMNRK
jgi:TonB-dependent SusC/RagA subfamily outer membrane receptor